jgi:hypothetical protein
MITQKQILAVEQNNKYTITKTSLFYFILFHFISFYFILFHSIKIIYGH